MTPLNSSFLWHEPVQRDPTPRDNAHEADKGLFMKSVVTITPGLRLYRFASSNKPEISWYTSPWWVGHSPYEAIVEYARVNNMSLGQAARICLAVDPLWGSRCDMLVGASLVHPLSAWAGTPRTIRSKVEGHYTMRWGPDRRVTQLYIPGLTQNSGMSTQPIWQAAFQGLWHRGIASFAPR